jgi:hypothetical protein
MQAERANRTREILKAKRPESDRFPALSPGGIQAPGAGVGSVGSAVADLTATPGGILQAPGAGVGSVGSAMANMVPSTAMAPVSEQTILGMPLLKKSGTEYTNSESSEHLAVTSEVSLGWFPSKKAASASYLRTSSPKTATLCFCRIAWRVSNMPLTTGRMPPTCRSAQTTTHLWPSFC